VRIGVGLFLIAVGAIFTFAVRDSLSGVDLSAVGVILMLVGAAIVVLWWMFWGSRSPARRPPRVIEREVPVERVVEREVPTERERTRERTTEFEGPMPQTDDRRQVPEPPDPDVR
jgi:hypothetical protein